MILLAVILFVNRELLFGEKRQSEKVTELLEQVDGVIGELDHDSLSPGSVRAAGPVIQQEGGVDETQPSGRRESRSSSGDVENNAVPETTSSSPSSRAGNDSADKPGKESGVKQTEAEQEPDWEIWQQARFAAWQGDYASSIKHYRLLVVQQPDNYDAYGEMGNVLLHSGDRDGAAEAYYQAALLLNDTPHHMMAWQLLNLLAWLSPEKADKLYQELLARH